MRKTTGAAMVAAAVAIWHAMVAAAGAIIWQKTCEGSIGLDSRPCSKEVNKPSSHFRAGEGKLTDGLIVVSQVPAGPIEEVQHTWERYLGQPMEQRVRATCVLVACTVCVEAVHRLQHEKHHGKGTFPSRAAPPDVLLEACLAAGIWNPGAGAVVRDVLTTIRQMGGVLATTFAPTRAQTLLRLRSWEEHRWDDFAATALSPGRMADLLYNNGPCIGVLWVSSPWYDRVDADRNDAEVYISGFGRSDDDARRKIEEDPEANAGWHAVVCFGYRFRGDQMHVLVLDNQTSTGPTRWIHSEEFHTLYTLSV